MDRLIDTYVRARDYYLDMDDRPDLKSERATAKAEMVAAKRALVARIKRSA